jgi:hypothetical protein
MKKGLIVTTFLAVALHGAAFAAILSDPPAGVTHAGDQVILRKELNAYGRHGVADGACDILYTADSGTWTFDLTVAGLTASDYTATSVNTGIILDDHYAVPTSSYSIDVALDGVVSYSGPTDPLGLPHGVPYGGTPFTNWATAAFSPSSLSDPFLVTITNTSPAGGTDWIAVDYIEVVLTETAIPEPVTLALVALGTLGLAIRRG